MCRAGMIAPYKHFHEDWMISAIMSAITAMNCQLELATLHLREKTLHSPPPIANIVICDPSNCSYQSNTESHHECA